MRVWQVPAARHPTLSALWDVLKDCPRPGPSDLLQKNGDLLADIAAGVPAKNHINAAVRSYYSLGWLRDAAAKAAPGLEIRGVNYYPPGGGMSWHTNHTKPGWRAYVVRSPEERSYFGTVDGVLLDRNGWANIFLVGKDSWHYVMAPTERWSVGVLLPDALAAEILGPT